jgi:hypothetical protein
MNERSPPWAPDEGVRTSTTAAVEVKDREEVCMGESYSTADVVIQSGMALGALVRPSIEVRKKRGFLLGNFNAEPGIVCTPV